MKSLESQKEEHFNFEKYKNDGWGLGTKFLEAIYDVITNHEKEELNILEFGSGRSTEFLVDVARQENKKIHIESYDDSEIYAYKLQDGDDKYVDVNIRRLVHCNEKNFSSMFLDKKYNKEYMQLYQQASHTRQRNCFYDFLDHDLKKQYDIIVLDGPNGSGRSLAYLHLQDIIDYGLTYVCIDDYDAFDHVYQQPYPYIQCLKYMFDVELVFHHKANWEGDEPPQSNMIYKILGAKDKQPEKG